MERVLSPDLLTAAMRPCAPLPRDLSSGLTDYPPPPQVAFPDSVANSVQDFSASKKSAFGPFVNIHFFQLEVFHNL